MRPGVTIISKHSNPTNSNYATEVLLIARFCPHWSLSTQELPALIRDAQIWLKAVRKKNKKGKKSASTLSLGSCSSLPGKASRGRSVLKTAPKPKRGMRLEFCAGVSSYVAAS